MDVFHINFLFSNKSLLVMNIADIKELPNFLGNAGSTLQLKRAFNEEAPKIVLQHPPDLKGSHRRVKAKVKEML